MRRRFHSLQVQLAVGLALLYIAVTAIAAGVLVYRAYDTAGSLGDRELSLRAEDLASSISLDAAGNAHLELPHSLARAYATGADADIYAIRSSDGRMLAASPPGFGERVKGWPAPGDDPSYFRLTDFGDRSESYYGLSVAVGSAAGTLWVSVARAGEANALVQSLLWEFVADLAWGIPVLLVVTLAMGVLAIRKGFKQITQVSQMAAEIGPNTTSVRLPEHNLPSEITPLVSAVNRAFDRLEHGFAVQRQFTANAAHELRTPLAIVTGALESMADTPDLVKLRGDTARMNRLVEQLLRVARLDAIALDVSGTVDLDAIGADVVGKLAPWAIGQARPIAYAGSGEPVHVMGNGDAIADAIRNLIENAVTHSANGNEIEVRVDCGGRVSVADHGPGVAVADRERVFERFWRGKGVGVEGAGLGLAIVKEIMSLHGGTVTIADNPGGGAVFTLSFGQQSSLEQPRPRTVSPLVISGAIVP